MTTATNAPTIIDAIGDPHLFRPYFADANDSIVTWRNWATALRVLYGLPIHPGSYDLIRQCTGRDPTKLPAEGFNTALFLTGRKCGKSKVIAAVGAFEAVLSGREHKLSRGEKGIVAVCSPTMKQSRIVHGYMRAIFDTPLLAPEVVEETKDSGFELRGRGNSSTRIEMLAGRYDTIRGYTLRAAIVDEAAFFGIGDESKIRSDTELIRAIQPALITTGGRLLAISSPYAKRGWTWETYQRNFANDNGKILIWNSSSKTMNPTLPQSSIDAAMMEDRAAALSEYMGQFRDDVGLFLPREVIERLVIPDRFELLATPEHNYVAFCDLSGGRNDSAALAVAHREGRKCVLDLLRVYKPPFSPHQVCLDMAHDLRRYSLRQITGDNYAADFVAGAFRTVGIHYIKCDKPKAALYLELLPMICSGEIEFLDNDLLVNQLAALERRTRAGGRDIVDHPRDGHDDIANAVAGVACGARVAARCGSLFT